MIEVQKNYKISLTEEEARQLYLLLSNNKEDLILSSIYENLRELHNQLKQVFGNGIR